MQPDLGQRLVAVIRPHLVAEPQSGLAARLEVLVDAARGVRPRIRVSPETFVDHVGKHWGAATDLLAALDGCAVSDLYLACACAHGDAAALAILDADELPRASAYVARVHRAPDFVAEVLQQLRVKILLPRDGRLPAIADYSGRGPLGGWLRIAAVRTARTLIKSDARFVTLRTDSGDAPAKSSEQEGHGPETHLLKNEGTDEMNRALGRALGGLSDRDRALLRLYFVEGMSLAALGRIYHVHESTMMRRLHALREKLLEELKKELAASSNDLASRLALIESQLDLHLSQHLRGR